MVLQDGVVIVQDGQLAAAVTQEGAVTTGVVNIVDDGTWNTELRHTWRTSELRTYQADDAVQVIKVVRDALLLQEVSRGLQHIGRMAGVVIAVGTVVIGFYQSQPVLHDALLHLQCFIHLEPQQGRHPQPDQGPKYRLINFSSRLQCWVLSADWSTSMSRFRSEDLRRQLSYTIRAPISNRSFPCLEATYPQGMCISLVLYAMRELMK